MTCRHAYVPVDRLARPIDQDIFDVRACAEDLLKFRVVLAIGDNHAGFGEVQLVFQVFRYIKNDGGDKYRSNLTRSMGSNDESRAIGEMGQDEITFRYPTAEKPVCQPVHLLIELTVCEDLLVVIFVDEDDERLIAMLPNFHFQQLAQILFPAEDGRIVGIQDLHFAPRWYYFWA